MRLPVRWRGATRARLDNRDWLPVTYSSVGEVLLGNVVVPSGTHTVYVTFTASTGGNFVNVNWFTFS